MKHAIQLLKEARAAAILAEPIHRASRDLKAARRDRDLAWDCLDAITVLAAVDKQRKESAFKAKEAKL